MPPTSNRNPSSDRNLPAQQQQKQPEFAAGSLLGTAIPVCSLKESRVKVCLYGRNRSGKTTLACMFRKPLLIISAEPDENGGATSVTDIDGVSLIRVSDKLLGQDANGRWVNATDPTCVRADKLKGTAKFVAIAHELAVSNPFATVVVDTVTSLQDIVLVEVMKLPKVPEMLDWGSVPEGGYQRRAEKWRSAMRPFLELNNSNIVVLAQEKDHNAPEERGGKAKILHTMQQGSFMAPALGATNAQWLQDNCGYVVQIYEDEVMKEVTIPMLGPDGKPAPPIVQKMGTGKRARHLRLIYHPNFAAGGRWKYTPNMPEFVTATDPAGLYAALAAYIPALK